MISQRSASSAATTRTARVTGVTKLSNDAPPGRKSSQEFRRPRKRNTAATSARPVASRFAARIDDGDMSMSDVAEVSLTASELSVME